MYVRMGPVEVWISTDSVSLIIIPFSDVDRIELYKARKCEAVVSLVLTPISCQGYTFGTTMKPSAASP